MRGSTLPKEPAPKRRRMMDMILTLGGLKEESTVSPSQANEEIANLKTEIVPLTDEILMFPNEYFQIFLKTAERVKLADRIKDRAVLREALDNLEGAVSKSAIGSLTELMELLTSALQVMEDGKRTETAQETVDIESTLEPLQMLVSQMGSAVDEYEQGAKDAAKSASAELGELVETLFKLALDLKSNPQATLDSLEELGISTRFGHSPCRVACPAEVNGQAFVTLTREGQFDVALKVVRDAIPFPGTLGRVCTHPCEVECERSKIDQPVSIRNLHRFLADFERLSGSSEIIKPAVDKSDRIAVVGAGPAGIACAYDMARMGYPVTIFESKPESGGLLRYGIPEYRLPRDILQEEIARVQELGVDIITGRTIKSPSKLLEEDYRAVFVATGASSSRKMGIEGEDAKGVFYALEFLERINKRDKVVLGEKVAVIGGGNAAVDSARTARRLGGKQVTIFYRRSRKEMPAIASEVDEAEKEGVEINLLCTPISILESGGRVNGIRCIKMKLGKPDDSGRRRPVPITDSEFDVEIDNVIVAIGQEINSQDYFSGLEYNQWGYLQVNPLTLQTSVKGVYAGGDVVSGPSTVVKAVAFGRKAAKSIDYSLRGISLSEAQPEHTPMIARIEADKISSQEGERAIMPTLDFANRAGSFEEVELGFDEASIAEETKRCLCCSVLTAAQIKHKLEGVQTPEPAFMELLLENLLVELRRGVIIFILNNMGSKTVVQLAELTKIEPTEVQQTVVTMMQRGEIEMVGLEGTAPVFSRVLEAVPDATLTLGQIIRQVRALTKSLKGAIKSSIENELASMELILNRLKILGQYDEAAISKPMNELRQIVGTATEASLSSQASDTSDDLRLHVSAGLEAFERFRLKIALEKGPNLVAEPNVYGEKLDPEVYKTMMDSYLDNELERGTMLILIRELGAMSAKDLAEKTKIPQDRVFSHLLRMKRDELLLLAGEEHGYVLYDVPRTLSEVEIATKTVSDLALKLASAKVELESVLGDFKAKNIGRLATSLETFSKARDKLEKVTVKGSVVAESVLEGVEDKVKSAVAMTYRTRAKLPSTRPKVTIEELMDVDVPSVLEEYRSQVGYAPLLGFGTIEWEQSKCLGCKSCEIDCPEDAIELKPVIDVQEFFELSEESMKNLPVNKALFYQTVRNLATKKPVERIRLANEAPGFGTIEVDLWLCVGCRTCVRRCPGPENGALELVLKWNLPEVVKQITSET